MQVEVRGDIWDPIDYGCESLVWEMHVDGLTRMERCGGSVLTIYPVTASDGKKMGGQWSETCQRKGRDPRLTGIGYRSSHTAD